MPNYEGEDAVRHDDLFVVFVIRIDFVIFTIVQVSAQLKALLGTCYLLNAGCCVSSGYCLPEPVFQTRVKETVESVMTALRDPSLPLLELQVSGQRFCPWQLMARYVLHKFPSSLFHVWGIKFNIIILFVCSRFHQANSGRRMFQRCVLSLGSYSLSGSRHRFSVR